MLNPILTARYNRDVKVGTCALAVCIALLCGCKKDIQNTDAVKQGVLNYLSKRGDLMSMDVSVNSVSFRSNEADASVHFQAKGNTSAAAGMSMNYVLERKGNEWVVKGRSGSGAPHGLPSGAAAGGTDALPPGHPTVSPTGAPSQGLPPGHPAVEGDSAPQGLPPLPTLPPSHPPPGGSGKKPDSTR